MGSTRTGGGFTESAFSYWSPAPPTRPPIVYPVVVTRLAVEVGTWTGRGQVQAP